MTRCCHGNHFCQAKFPIFKEEYTTVRVSSGKVTQMFFSHPKNRNVLSYAAAAISKTLLQQPEHTLELFFFPDQRVKKE